MATATSIQYVQKMFIAYLGRGASTEALTYWGDQIDADESAKDALFFDLYNSTEGQALYDGKTQDQVIDAIFQNSFERAAETAGKTFYKAELDAGNLNLVSMAGAIVDSADTAGAQVFDYKNQAAEHYRTSVDASDGYVFVPTESKAAVDPVDGPNTLVASKAAVDAVVSGVGSTIALTSAADTPTMTGGDDTVTGVVGDAPVNTYSAADIIVDGSSTDSDTLALTADKDITFGTVTKVEAVNISYAEQLGAGMTMTDVQKVTGGTINLTAASTVDVVGVTVTGETVVTATGALTSNLNTVGVTSLTATSGAVSSLTISGDDKLGIIQVNAIDSNDTIISTASVGTATTATDIDLDGTAATNDVASVSAVGQVNLDVSDADDVENLTLSGNGAAVDFAVSGVTTATNVTYTIAGDQAVTLSAAGSQLNGTTIVQSGTGSLGIDMTGTPADLDLTGVTLAGGLDISGDVGGGTDEVIKLKSGTAVSITASQTNGTLTFDANDTANDSEISIALSTNDAAVLKTLNMDTVTIATGDSARTIGAIQMGANDAEVAIVGTNDITITAASASGKLTVSGQKVTLSNTQDVDGDLTITGTNDVTLSNTATVDNDVSIESATAVSYKDIVSTNGDIVIKGDSVSSDKKLLAANDITIESTNDVSLTEANAMVADATTGSITISGKAITAADHIDAQNDVTITGTNDVIVEQVTATTGSISISGTAAENTAAVVATAGNVTLSASNDAFTSDIDGAVTASAGTISLTDGKFDASTVTLTANKFVVSGDTDVLGGIFVAESLLVTSTNDVTIDALDEQNLGDGLVLSGAAATGDIDVTVVGNSTGTVTLVTGAGNDALTINEDTIVNVTAGGGADIITVTDIAANSVLNGAEGDDVFALNDVGSYNAVGGEGNDTFTLAAGATATTLDGGNGTDTIALSGDVTVNLDMKNIEVVTMGAATTLHAVNLANDASFELGGSQTFKVEADNTGQTIDLSSVTTNVLAAPTSITLAGGTGADTLTGAVNYANTITGNAGANIITGGNGIDTITGGTAVDIINAGQGADILVGGTGNDTINGGAGADIITGGAGADIITGGADADVFTFGNSDSDKAEMDIILDYATGADKISNGAQLVLHANTDAAGKATVSATGLVTGYNGAATAYDTLLEKQTQIDLALGDIAHHSALFTHDSKTYLYIAVGTDTSNDGTDTFIELTGVTATTGLTLTGQDISAIS